MTNKFCKQYFFLYRKGWGYPPIPGGREGVRLNNLQPPSPLPLSQYYLGIFPVIVVFEKHLDFRLFDVVVITVN